MTSRAVLGRAMLYGLVFTAVIAFLGSVIGYIVAGTNGVASALLGALLSAVFLGLTTVSILFAARISGQDQSGMRYFAVVLGVWFLKIVVFLSIAISLLGQPWLSSAVFGWVLIATVIGSLIADILAMQRSRVPYLGDIELPGQGRDSAADREGAA